MAENQQTSGDFPWLPLITLIAVGSGVFFLLPQITSSRPGGGDPKLVTTFDPQAINARLWQDPLGVVSADQDRDKERPQSRMTHSIRLFQELLRAKYFWKSPNLVLTRENLREASAQRLQRFQPFDICAVMIPGGPYVEDVERRIRARRAVIEGLGLAHYGPEKDHEVGYICLPWRPLAQNVSTSVSMLEEDRNASQEPATAPSVRPKPVRQGSESLDNPSLLVPYEWFEVEDFGVEGTPDRHLLVLWLNDDAFVDAPLARLADLVSWFRFKVDGNAGNSVVPLSHYIVYENLGVTILPLPRFIVLGPDNSGTFHKMVQEAKDHSWNDDTRQLLATTTIYSSQAAAADKLLMAETHSDSPNSEFFIENAVTNDQAGSTFTIERTLPLDDKIVKALWVEISKRVKPQDHVAVISELDTYYARALSQSFILARDHSVDTFSYIRGIDGKLPSDRKGNEPKEATDKSDEKAPSSSRPAEQTEGLNQADDIRRLARLLQKRDRELQSKQNARLKAVALLGSDVYDKLELLKALRPALPEAVFFTNNLDARLVHPDEWGETHNLIVASPFPLSLKGSDKVPPFRDSGQTSMFAVTLAAFGKEMQLPCAPFIYEVGRNGLIELKTPEPAQFKFAIAYLCAGLAALLVTWIWFVSQVAEKKDEAEPPAENAAAVIWVVRRHNVASRAGIFRPGNRRKGRKPITGPRFGEI
jgi:hypothetical protein